MFKDIFLTTKVFHFLTFGDQSADARFGVKAGDPGAASAHAFGQSALRTEFNFQLTRQILPLKFFILAHIRRNHFSHLLRPQQLADAFIVNAGIVRHKGQARDPAIAHSIHQAFGKAAKAIATACNQNVVFQHARERRFGIGEKFFSH